MGAVTVPVAEKATMERRASRAALSDVSWRATEDLSFAEWLENGRRLGLMGRSAGWWLGDWLSYGNHAFGERYARASRITGYDAQTLMNMAYVASRFEVSRRRGKLSWSHHAEIAAMDPEEQDYWLTRAETDRLSVRCMREGIRRERLGKMKAEQEARASGSANADAGERPAPHAHGRPEADVVCPECGHAFLTDDAAE
jgi:hypothetical protein